MTMTSNKISAVKNTVRRNSMTTGLFPNSDSTKKKKKKSHTTKPGQARAADYHLQWLILSAPTFWIRQLQTPCLSSIFFSGRQDRPWIARCAQTTRIFLPPHPVPPSHTHWSGLGWLYPASSVVQWDRGGRVHPHLTFPLSSCILWTALTTC